MRFGLEATPFLARQAAFLLLAVPLAGQALACMAPLSPGDATPGAHAATAPSQATRACVLSTQPRPAPAVTEASACPAERWLQALPSGKPPSHPAGEAVPRGPAPLPDAAAAMPASSAWPYRPRWLLTARLRI